MLPLEFERLIFGDDKTLMLFIEDFFSAIFTYLYICISHKTMQDSLIIITTLFCIIFCAHSPIFRGI